MHQKDTRTMDSFRDADQHTVHVFEVGEETGVPGGNPQSRGDIYMHTLCTQDRRQDSNTL